MSTIERSAAGSPPRVLVVGAGWRFTSGISYYTCRLTNAFAEHGPAGALLMRRLVPRMLYPGRRRVGRPVHDLSYAPGVPVYDGVDWYWGRSIVQARRHLLSQAPDVVVLQWWTGAVVHSYLLLAALARRRGARVVIEWHEVQDTGEARVAGTVRYVRRAMSWLLRHVDGHVVHSQHDLALLRSAYGLDPDVDSVVVVPHGPYDHHATPNDRRATAGGKEATPDQDRAPAAGTPVADQQRRRTPATRSGPARPDLPEPVESDFTFLYFGVIRPYKGVEDLVAAFELLPESVRSTSRLVIVGETWEGWDAPLRAAAASPARSRITVVNRYVSDSEVSAHFADADAVVLPYRRSSSSGPLHIAMSAGLPVVVSAVGGLVEAAEGYDGALFTSPGAPADLAEAMQRAVPLRGRRFADVRSWTTTLAGYAELMSRIGLRTPVAAGTAGQN